MGFFANSFKLAGKAAMFSGREAAKLGWAGAKQVPGVARMGYGAAKRAYPAANFMSKMVTGGSIPQIATVSGIGLAAFGMLSSDPVGQAQRAGRFMQDIGQQMRMSSRPTYGQTAFQESVQGLTFGLNSRRNSY